MTQIVYAESSAILSWLLREPTGPAVRERLEKASDVVTSRLTLIECQRNIRRTEREGRITREAAVSASRILEDAASQWIIMDLVGEVPGRAAEEFPREPLGTLDAMHLASAQVFDRNLGKVAMLTLDDRIRTNAVALGLSLAL
jgi:predicted nucleic acid-binding protein